ncbi:hypothetical protein C7974DRAFT_434019 [Boeremia exigua]|uniref:uncharacterized protein n=1 Tax=Boeremia exigua TaxID=749465 RepID=UPI001E8D0860|nr:uncharacterized protein C7974DRAFT_434019 [Boeremia exigua]KAH6629458.1 hypothetical protein C7974DRAFT_434019 [Boeremia exigua]
MSPSLPYAADVESPLKPDELQVLRAQYEKEGEYVGLQTKFNYAWGLIKSNERGEQQEGVRLLSDIFRGSRERRRECLYYLALGNYKLGNYAEARRYNELLLELEPANLQAGSLKGLIDEKVAKEGLVGAAISANQNAPAPAGSQRPGHRDMMFCHECADEWYRDERGLTCPECGSDFTEIIEDDNDPRDSNMFGHDGDQDDDEMSDVEHTPPHPNPHQSPFADDDPEEADISNFNLVRIGPGRFNVQATITRSVSPRGLGAGVAPGSIGGFMSMLNGLTQAAVQGQPPARGQSQGQGEGLFSGAGQSAYQESQGAGQPSAHAGRFTYHGGARLAPRGDGMGMRVEPVDDISNVMTGLMAALGAQNMPQGGDGSGRGGPGGEHVPAPFLNLFQSLGLIPGGGQMGDFVYSQEGLDRIVSQLMEQTATNNAPPPATQDDIDALPKKQVSEDMLGPEHKAECSICIDEVNIGETVTELPCKHWFHHSCVSAWLIEHDTCPHCRKGITKHQEGGASAQASASTAQASTGPQPTGSRSMPGAFDAADPYVVPSESGSADNQATGTSTATDAAPGGVSERVRRGWSDSQS